MPLPWGLHSLQDSSHLHLLHDCNDIVTIVYNHDYNYYQKVHNIYIDTYTSSCARSAPLHVYTLLTYAVKLRKTQYYMMVSKQKVLYATIIIDATSMLTIIIIPYIPESAPSPKVRPPPCFLPKFLQRSISHD